MKKFLLFTFTMMLLGSVAAWGQNSVDVYGGTADPTTAMEGETVTLTATIPGGMTFNGWSSTPTVEFADANSPSTTFTMPATGIIVTATYKAITYTVDVTGGSADREPAEYAEGATVTVTADPPAGKELDAWTSTPTVTFADASSPSTSFEMPASNVTVTATYKDILYTVTVTGGTADPAPAVEGATVNLTLTVGEIPEGQEFDAWTTDDLGVTFADANATSTTFTMPDNAVTVTATYKDILYTVAVTGGTADVATAVMDATVNLTADAAPIGQMFDTWTSDAGGTFAVATAANTTFTMPAANVILTATYKAIVYPATVALADLVGFGDATAVGNDYTLARNMTLPVGSDLQIAAGQSLTIPGSTTLTNNGSITNDGTLTVKLGATLDGSGTKSGNDVVYETAPLPPAEPAEYTILAWAGDNGTITPTGALAVLEGDSAVFTFIPNEGYSVDVLTVDGEVIPRAEITGNSYTFRNVAGYHEITVTFRAGIPTANEDVEAGLKAYARDGQLYVSGLTPGEVWSVYSVTGAIIYQGTADGSEAVIQLPARGIYIIKAGGSTVKVAAVN